MPPGQSLEEGAFLGHHSQLPDRSSETPPLPIYAVREYDENHVLELIESFEEKDSMNRKGIGHRQGSLERLERRSSGRIFLRPTPRS